jgi:hypothetical protein
MVAATATLRTTTWTWTMADPGQFPVGPGSTATQVVAEKEELKVVPVSRTRLPVATARSRALQPKIANGMRERAAAAAVPPTRTRKRRRTKVSISKISISKIRLDDTGTTQNNNRHAQEPRWPEMVMVGYPPLGQTSKMKCKLLQCKLPRRDSEGWTFARRCRLHCCPCSKIRSRVVIVTVTSEEIQKRLQANANTNSADDGKVFCPRTRFNPALRRRKKMPTGLTPLPCSSNNSRREMKLKHHELMMERFW